MKRLSAQAMKEIDRRAQEEYGISGLVLMENAGLRSADVVRALLKGKKLRAVAIFCGPGNNGGDGFVIARHCINHRIAVRVFVLGMIRQIHGDALINYRILKKMNARLDHIRDAAGLRDADRVVKKAGLVVDAIFGIGLNKNVEGIFSLAINRINASRVPVMSVDTPSGLCASTGKILGVCVQAHTTVTFGAAKKGFFTAQARKHVGTLIVADIGLPRQLLNTNYHELHTNRHKFLVLL